MQELIPGVEMPLGGEVRIIPPLSLGSLERLQDKLAALNSFDSPLAPEAIKTIAEAAHAALKRNYPSLRLDEVKEWIDLGNMHEVIACVMDVAGVKRKAQIEAKKQGAQPPAGTSAPAGPVD